MFLESQLLLLLLLLLLPLLSVLLYIVTLCRRRLPFIENSRIWFVDDEANGIHNLHINRLKLSNVLSQIVLKMIMTTANVLSQIVSKMIMTTANVLSQIVSKMIMT